jgi:two-component system, NarL family, response regulator DegU
MQIHPNAIRHIDVNSSKLIHLGKLTERDLLVIKLVSSGWKNKEIARWLRTTEHVVKNIVRNIYDKLGLWNRTELALWECKRKEENNEENQYEMAMQYSFIFDANTSN